MIVKFERPPLWDEIVKAFPHATKSGVLFAWGTTIYNPSRVDVPPEIRAHEDVHGSRQGADVAGWWRRYIADPEFRIAEEIPAHIAEYRYFKDHPRNVRRMALHHIAKRLSGPLYGSLICYEDARRILKQSMMAAERPRAAA